MFTDLFVGIQGKEESFLKSNAIKETEAPASEEYATILIPTKPALQKTVICDMCGHTNPDNVAFCKMCSNYLKEATL